jgi:hypothetical protein
MQFSPFSRHLIPLRSKYPPQHPVLLAIQYHLNVSLKKSKTVLKNVVTHNLSKTLLSMQFPQFLNTDCTLPVTEGSRVRSVELNVYYQ